MKKGIGLIAAVVAITVVTWLFTPPTTDIPWLRQTAELFGALGLVGLALGFVVSTRLHGLVGAFGGQGKTLTVHKWLGLASICAILVHIALLLVTMASRSPNVSPLTRVGPVAVVLLVVLIPIALFGRKLTHRRWLFIHHFMILPYVVGLVHYYGSSDFAPFGFNAFSVWMDIVALIGLGSAAYALLVRRAAPAVPDSSPAAS